MDRRNFLKGAALSTAGLIVLPGLPIGTYMLRAGRMGDGGSGVASSFTGDAVFDRLMKLADENNWKSLPIGERIGEIALALRGTPYVGGTLDTLVDQEIPTVTLEGLDCVTLFESALGFARMLKKGGSTPDNLLEQVMYTRYRDGRLGDYTSRLHYTSDWLYDNEEKRVVKVITRDLAGAERFTQEVNFMSTHTDSYKQLKAHPDLVRKIAETERIVNKRRMYWVPKEKVEAIEPKLHTGDIIGITTSFKGLDCSHTGLCYRDKESGMLRYLHASSTKKQVILDDQLSKYLASVTKHTGIMVARAIE